jgi:drug/metabolite transporter (DMT)-like permease
MAKLDRKRAATLILLTVFWGVNWPVMKAAVTGYPPMTFRALSMALGLPCLALGLFALKSPFAVARRHWRELTILAVTNMVIWHVGLMLALPHLSSGRAAILGYTMPVFSALWGMSLWGQRLDVRQAAGIAAAAAGIVLLLWHEVSRLSGVPVAAMLLLASTAVWALGTQQLRRTRMEVPTLTIAFWMTAIATASVCVLALLTEASRWRTPTAGEWGAVAYNAVLIFGFCHASWFALARVLPPVASSVSISFIPVIGLLSGCLWLGEPLHWQDGAAMALIVIAIATVLWPVRRQTAVLTACEA